MAVKASIDAWHWWRAEDTWSIRANTTAPGRRRADLRMSRRFVEEQRCRSVPHGAREGPADRHPRRRGVVPGADTWRFDLDPRRIAGSSRLTAGSMVLDPTKDGSITDGRELFGPTIMNVSSNSPGSTTTATAGSTNPTRPTPASDGPVPTAQCGRSPTSARAIATRAVTSPFLLTEPTAHAIGEVRATGLAPRDDGGAAPGAAGGSGV
ncbi:MAG: hypothetical protein R2713_15760 [Ilumatobacteraceae bacterium]